MTMFDAIRRMFNARQSGDPKHPTGRTLVWFGRSEAGPVPTFENIAGEATAWACADVIARTAAVLPCSVQVARGGAEDGNETLPDHPVTWLLHRQPNRDTVASTMRYAQFLGAIFDGNSYAEIERDTGGRPYAIWPLARGRTEPMRYTETGPLFYRYSLDDGGHVDIEAENIFHLRGPTLDGVVGLSMIDWHRHTLGLALAQKQFAGAFLRNGAAPSGVLKIKGKVTDEGMQRLREQFRPKFGGSRNAGEPLYLDDSMDWETVGISQQDAEFLAQRKFSVEEVCRIFGVPPVKVGYLEKGTYNNFEQSQLAFHADGLLPWLIRWEQEANAKMFRRALSGRGTPFVKLNVNGILRADTEKRYRSYALGREWGWLSANDIRRLEDLEPIGPQGDEYLVPSSMGPGDNTASIEDADRARAISATPPNGPM